ncbi:transposase [Shewanella algae]|uniref:transposase n=1 Tax=Shewanella algae TaxID=38313 RepID=UPI0021F07288|nr:transposase [Shewanella algae]
MMGISKPSQGCAKHQKDMAVLFLLHTCRLEGMNNKIKLLKRMGYGYRDTEYFFLKVREAFPGDPR